MSRHQAVKAINDKVTKSQAYDDLDDYDDEEYDAEEAEEQMRDGVRRAREVLGDEFTEEQIRESLWHYFYDVEKTVNYLLSKTCVRSSRTELTTLEQKTAAQSKPPPNRSKGQPKSFFSIPNILCTVHFLLLAAFSPPNRLDIINSHAQSQQQVNGCRDKLLIRVLQQP